MRLMVHLSRDEVAELPYAVICEAKEGARWNTGKRRRLWKLYFNTIERERAESIFKKAHKFYLTTGIPEKGMILSTETLELWHKLADFCAEL